MSNHPQLFSAACTAILSPMAPRQKRRTDQPSNRIYSYEEDAVRGMMNRPALQRLSQTVGWQFNVVRIGTLVLKYPKSASQTRLAITSRPWGQELSPERLSALILEVSMSAKRSLAALRNHPLALEHCGRPRLLPLNVVIQEAGRSFLDLTRDYTLEPSDTVRHFFSISQSLWRCGLFETTFDFFRNYGMTRSGVPFCIDLGDFIDDPSRASVFLEKEHWKTRRDYMALDADTRELFDSLASQYLIPDRLYAAWETTPA